MALYLESLNKTLHAQAKAAAALAGVHLKDWVEMAIQEKLDNDQLKK